MIPTILPYESRNASFRNGVEEDLSLAAGEVFYDLTESLQIVAIHARH